MASTRARAGRTGGRNARAAAAHTYRRPGYHVDLERRRVYGNPVLDFLLGRKMVSVYHKNPRVRAGNTRSRSSR